MNKEADSSEEEDEQRVNLYTFSLQTIELNQRKKVYIDGRRVTQLPHSIPAHGISIDFTPSFVVCSYYI